MFDLVKQIVGIKTATETKVEQRQRYREQKFRVLEANEERKDQLLDREIENQDMGYFLQPHDYLTGVMEVNDDSSSSDDVLINNNLLHVLSRTAQLLLQINASSSNIQMRNTIHKDRLERSFSALQKCTSSIRQLSKTYNPDSLEEYLNMSERTSREALENFCYGVVQMYEPEYLRRPASTDIQLLNEAHEARHGFPRM
uniref:Uncharacterized protein n=1 Tax=Lactuca sativa TaxID=4236 RepID=A0A9R1USE4_LACSA|nr:hypothetical protein LSAT_V11C800451600 [Lactuca sativa]